MHTNCGLIPIEHGVRRSRRQHRGKSALELLGISPKKVAKSNTSSSVKNVKKTPVKPDKLTDNAVIKKTENEKPIQSEKNAQQEKTTDYIRVEAKSDQNRSCDVTVSDGMYDSAEMRLIYHIIYHISSICCPYPYKCPLTFSHLSSPSPPNWN